MRVRRMRGGEMEESRRMRLQSCRRGRWERRKKKVGETAWRGMVAGETGEEGTGDCGETGEGGTDGRG